METAPEYIALDGVNTICNFGGNLFKNVNNTSCDFSTLNIDANIDGVMDVNVNNLFNNSMRESASDMYKVNETFNDTIIKIEDIRDDSGNIVTSNTNEEKRINMEPFNQLNHNSYTSSTVPHIKNLPLYECKTSQISQVHKKSATYKKDSLHYTTTANNDNANMNKCEVCNMTFRRCSSLTNHMKIHSYLPGRALLNKLAETTKSNVQLAEVLSGTANLNMEEFEKDSQSRKCNLPPISVLNLSSEDFKREMTLHAVQNFKQQNFKNPKCSQNISEKLNVGVNEMKVGATSQYDLKQYKRDIINKEFVKKKIFLLHKKIHDTDKTYQCDFCDLHFDSVISLYDHLIVCNIKEEGIEYTLSLDSRELLKYKKIDKMYMCLECKKKFQTKQKLQRHMMIHKKRPFICEKCCVNFQNQNDLDAHRLKYHMGNTPFGCGECGKNFATRQGLYEHNRIHKVQSKLYNCDTCDKSFISRQGLLIHNRSHTDERPYGCQYCWKAFKDGGTLRKHERIHTGERPHPCPLCLKAFNQKVVLREHLRWLHAVNVHPDSRKQYQCSLCNNSFHDLDELCAHFVKHSDQLALMIKNASKKVNNVLFTNFNETDKSNNRNNVQIVSLNKSNDCSATSLSHSNSCDVDVSLNCNIGTSLSSNINTSLNCNMNTSLNCNIDTSLNCNINTSLNCNIENSISCNIDTSLNCNINTPLNCDIDTLNRSISNSLNCNIKPLNSNEDNAVEILCDLCGANFLNKNELIEHVAVHI